MTASPSLHAPRPRPLVRKCTCGDEASERCSQAFTVTSTALAAGAEVSMWLTGPAVWLAVPGRAESFVLAQSAALAGLRDAVLGGGRLTVCTQRAARRELDQDDLIAGVRIAGSTTYIEEILAENVQAVAY